MNFYHEQFRNNHCKQQTQQTPEQIKAFKNQGTIKFITGIKSRRHICSTSTAHLAVSKSQTRSAGLLGVIMARVVAAVDAETHTKELGETCSN